MKRALHQKIDVFLKKERTMAGQEKCAKFSQQKNDVKKYSNGLTIYTRRAKARGLMESTSTAKKVFTRDSTGLVKNVSFIDAITLNLGNMSVGTGLGVIGLTTILLPADIVN